MKKQEITAFMDWARRRIGSALYERCASYNDAVDYLGPEKLTKMKLLKPAAAWARRPFDFDLNLAGWLHDCLYLIGGDEASGNGRMASSARPWTSFCAALGIASPPPASPVCVPRNTSPSSASPGQPSSVTAR